jgi:hypothetical protein
MLALLVIKTSSSFRTSSILSPSSIINLRCVLCSLAEAVSPACTLMSERTRDGWKEGFLPHLRRDNAKPPHISTVSVSVSFSSCKPLAESQVKKNNASNPGNYSIVPFSTQNLFPQALQYVSAPTSWSTCTHLHSCQSLRPKSPGPNQPSIPEPRDSSHTHVPYIHISLLPSTFYTLNSLPFPAITYQPRHPHMQADLHHLPNPNLTPNSPLLIPQPTNLSAATPQPSQVKPSQVNSTSKQIKSPQGTLFRPHIAMTPQSSHNLISVVWTPLVPIRSQIFP